MAREKLQAIPCNLIENRLRQLNAEKFSRVNLEKARRNKSPKMYSELQMVQTPNGFEERVVEVEYPITADYVKSFEQSTDYKLDLDNAIANGQGGQNLGDVTFLQELYKMDTAQIEKLANNMKALTEKIKVQADTVKTVNNEKEVDNNG